MSSNKDPYIRFKRLPTLLGVIVVIGALIYLVYLTLMGPIQPLDPLPEDMTYIEFNVFPCFTGCPVYDMIITAKDGHDGSILWVGKQFTCIKGSTSKVFPRADLDRLIRQIEEADFFSFSRICYEHLPDAGEYHIDVSIGGQRNGTCSTFASTTRTPSALTGLARTLVSIAGASRCDEPGF